MKKFHERRATKAARFSWSTCQHVHTETMASVSFTHLCSTSVILGSGFGYATLGNIEVDSMDRSTPHDAQASYAIGCQLMIPNK
ncbi:hypothetical protein EVAR_33579_1 [Eumeta japonica]|uniref:Uncharacterized protein n=1 Tax=Eumeta variegata TaxID=151549 RepID=A0A4C1VI99_EUMVA|nr:hypothetical protein EVAR_33579_1 [Eumeta japonica]